MLPAATADLDREAIERVRAAVGAYFSAAGYLAESSLLLQLAALAQADADDHEDREFLLDRAATYRDKAAHMSASGNALLDHAANWIQRLDATDAGELEQTLHDFAGMIDNAAKDYARVTEELTATSLGTHPTYAELMAELRLAVRFLQSEAAEFRRIAEEP
jgi:hypothetical protein